MKISILGVSVIIISFLFIFPTLNPVKVEAGGFYCPSHYECEQFDKVISGKANCPEGYDCIPFGMVPPDCPSGSVCYYKKKKSSPPLENPLEPKVFGMFISSIEPFSIYPGYEVVLKGQNLSASSSILITKDSKIITSLPQTSFNNESASSNIIKFTLPLYFVPGAYGLYLEGPDEKKSNSVSFYVTSVVPTSQNQNPTPASSTPSTPTLTTTPGNETTINSNYYNNYTPSNTDTTNNNNNAPNVSNTSTSGKFALNSTVQTTSNLRVRSTPSLTGAPLTTQPLGAQGTVKRGPINSDGYTWWNIDYLTGVDGWSVETYLTNSFDTTYTTNTTNVSATPTTTSNEDCFTFSNDLSLGSSIMDVMYLQVALIYDGFFIADSEKRPNSYFGYTTLAGVQGYQAKYGITPQAGYVRPKTRANLNLKYGCR